MAASSSGPSNDVDVSPSPRASPRVAQSPSNPYFSHSPAQTPRTPRPILRNATLIIPQTGLKTHRRVTLHEVDSADPDDDPPTSASHRDGSASSETSPLLRRRAHSAASRRKLGTRSVWQRVKLRSVEKAAQVRAFARSDVGKGVFKCSLAYLIGSMATFLPFLRDFLGVGLGGKHMVATVTVYFHPARSLGSMFDAYICAFAAFVYAAFICITSMSVSVVFTDFLDLMPIGHAIVLIVFCGGGLGFIGWVKQRMGDPLVNVACSLACLAIITVLTKEGAVQAGNYSFVKIAQVLKMVVMGVTATMAVSLTVFPVSARLNLRRSISTVTESLADMLALITNSFLTGFEDELQQKPFKTLTERHAKTYAVLSKNLKDSKYEHYVFGTERQHDIEARLVLCVQQVAQSLGGLRSAADMQFSVSKQTLGNGHVKLTTQSMVSTPTSLLSPPLRSGDQVGTLSAIDERSDEDSDGEATGDDLTRPQFSSESQGFRSPPEIFSLFIQHLGPSMKSLAFTLKEILDEEPFATGKGYNVIINPRLSSSLERAIQLYTTARQEALGAVYTKKDLNLNRPLEVEADWEEVAASCGHFSYSLLEVASQVRKYLCILDELQLEVDERPSGRTWSWLKFWRRWTHPQTSPEDPSSHPLLSPPPAPILHSHNHKHNPTTHLPSPTRIPPPPPHLTRKQRIFHRIWLALAVLRRDSTKFAIKVGVGASLYALPSFIPATRPIYTQWRGEWGLLSYMLVCSMTIGASNTTGYSRFLGTCLGAVCAVAAWHLSFGHAVPLALFGWLMALWTSYIIVGLGKGPMGRFIMLTYNLSALYAYALSTERRDDDEGGADEGGKNPRILEIAGHRVVSVLSGCIWGLVITRLVWPISAREKLREGLAGLWLKLALVWARDPLLVLLDETAGGEPQADPPRELQSAANGTTAASTPPSTASKPPTPSGAAAIVRETALQQALHALEALQSSARSEFELRGPFREVEYARLLKSAGRVLEALHAMDLVIARGGKGGVGATKGEVGLLRATGGEREMVCKRVGHLFSVLASSLALSYPLTSALPSTAHARDRLLARIFAYRRAEAAQNGTRDVDFGILYAFALVTGMLGSEIEGALGVVEGLFGRWEGEE